MLIRGNARDLRRVDGGRKWSPVRLFAAGEQGVWYDPSDLSTLFQDSAGTTPVTATGQPVGRMLDKSGRGNHATQATSGSRPVLQQDSNGLYFLELDGSDDGMATGSINFTLTSKVTLCAGVRKLTDGTAFKLIAELSANTDTNIGSFMIGAGTIAEAGRRNYACGISRGYSSSPRIDAPHTAVLSARYDVTQTTNTAALQLRINRDVQTLITNPVLVTASAFGNYPLYLFRRNGVSNGFDGRFYGMSVIGRQLSEDELLRLESYTNRKTRAYLI